MSEDVASAEQEEWVAVCAAVRAQIRKTAEMMPAMTPEEVASLCGAIDQAMWNEAKAATYDQAVEQRRQELIRGAAYGG